MGDALAIGRNRYSSQILPGVFLNSIVTVETYDLAYQAQFARSELEAEGIQCWLADETLVAMDWFISNAVGGIKLQVAFEDWKSLA